MATTDQKFTRSDVEALLAEKLGEDASDPRITGVGRFMGVFDEFIFYLVGDSDYSLQELHTLRAFTGANFTELDMAMAEAWVAGRYLI